MTFEEQLRAWAAEGKTELRLSVGEADGRLYLGVGPVHRYATWQGWVDGDRVTEMTTPAPPDLPPAEGKP